MLTFAGILCAFSDSVPIGIDSDIGSFQPGGLDGVKQFLVYDCRMVVPGKELFMLSVVLNARSAGVLVHVCLVYQHIPGVLLVPEDLLDGEYRPYIPA